MTNLTELEIAIRLLQNREHTAEVTVEFLLDLFKEVNTMKQWYTNPKVT